MLTVSYEGIVNKIKGILKTWKIRDLSVLGKVIVINSLIGSLFIYKMNVLPAIPNQIINTVNDLLSKFIWKEKKPKVSFDAMCCKKEGGGLRLVKLKDKDKALKLQWVSVYHSFPNIKAIANSFIDKHVTEMIWQSNLNKKGIKFYVKKGFWRDVITLWVDFNFNKPDNRSNVLNQKIWLNSNIRVNDHPCFNCQRFHAHQTFSK